MNNDFTNWNPLENNNSSSENHLEPTQPNYSAQNTSTDVAGITNNNVGNSPVNAPQPSSIPNDVGVSNSLNQNVSQPNQPVVNTTVNNNLQVESGSVRYNPVTGEEMTLKDLLDPKNKQKASIDPGQLIKSNSQSKISSIWNTFLLIMFFAFVVVFVMFLPEIQTVINNYKTGKINKEIEQITTGRLVCTLSTNSANLDRTIERVFSYEDDMLKSSVFTTTIKGDASLDEEQLTALAERCIKIRDNLSDVEGASVNCSYDNGILEERESFDYEVYDYEIVSNAYLNADSNLLELEYHQDIDEIMTKMRQGGFSCKKEKIE